MSEPERRYPYRDDSYRPHLDVAALIAEGEREFWNRKGVPAPDPAAQSQEVIADPSVLEAHRNDSTPLRVLSTEADVQPKSRLTEPSHRPAKQKHSPRQHGSSHMRRIIDRYGNIPVNARRGLMVGTAAVAVVTGASILTPSDDPRLGTIDFTELSDIRLSDVEVDYANVPIYYAIGLGDEKSPIPFYISDDPDVTGDKTIDVSDMSTMMYPKITSSEGVADGKEPELEHRFPSLFYSNRLETMVHRTGVDAAQYKDGKIEINRSAFSISAIDYEPGSINAPTDARVDYEPIVISGVDAENGQIPKASLDRLNLLFDADPKKEGNQPHPAILKVANYLARVVASDREWDCYKDLRDSADEALKAKVDMLVENQTAETFNANRKVVFVNDYVTPAQFYEAALLDGDAAKALANDRFIIDKEKLSSQAKVSCEIADASTERGDS